MTRVLIVARDAAAHTDLALSLSQREFEVGVAQTRAEALEAMRADPSDVAIIVDAHLDDGERADLLAELGAAAPDMSVVIVTDSALRPGGSGSQEGGVTHVTEDAGAEGLLARIEALVERRELQAARERAESALRRRLALCGLVARQAAHLVNLPYDALDNGIKGALQEVGQAIAAQASCFLWLPDGAGGVTAMEWFEERASPLGASLLAAARGAEMWWAELLGGEPQIVTPSAGPARLRALASSLACDALTVVPVRVRGAPVAVLAFAVSGGATPPENGDVPLLITVSQVLAAAMDRRRMDQAASNAEREWKSGLGAIGDVAVCLLDAEMRLRQHNQAFADLLGQTSDGLRGRPIFDLMPPTSGPEIDCPVRRMQRSGRSEARVRRMGERWQLVTADPLLDDARAVAGAVVVIRDVSEVHTAHRRMRFQAQLLASVREAVMATDADGRITHWGAGAEALYGHRAEDVLGTYIHDVIAYGGEAGNPMRAVWEAGAWEGQVRQRRADGTWFWEHLQLALVRDERGEPCGLVGISRDITDRVRAAQALAESESRWRALIENVADVILVLGADATVRYVSGSILRVLGYRHVGYRGLNITDYVHPDDLAAVQDAFATCLSNPGRVQRFEARVRHADGGWRDIEGTGLNRLQDPSVSGIVLNFRDVTARRRAECELRHHVEIGNLLAHVSSLFISSPSTNGDAAMRAALQAIGTFSGADRGLLLQVDASQARMTTTHEWCGPGTASRLDEARAVRWSDYGWLMHRMRAGEVIPVADVADMPDGAREEQGRLIGLGVRSSIAVPIAYQGRLAAALLLDCSQSRAWSESDVTVLRTVGEILANVLERQRTEEQLVQSAKMASLGIMAGGIAHEMRNPLGVIYATAQLLRDKPWDRVLCDEGVERILAACRRASEIIDGLLTFARPGDGQMCRMDVREALDDALELVAHRLSESKVFLVQRHANKLPLVLGNPGLITQVFANLVLNACNAMSDGGTITVSTRTAGGREVEVSVVDSGVGIAPEDLPHVFDPFFTTMPVGKGTGLGLTISYSIVQRHGGTIAMDSAPGGGTRVTVRLPCAERSHGG